MCGIEEQGRTAWLYRIKAKARIRGLCLIEGQAGINDRDGMKGYGGIYVQKELNVLGAIKKKIFTQLSGLGSVKENARITGQVGI